jgi:hypothetical protein
LIYAGRTDADLLHSDQARKYLEQAQSTIEQLMVRSPRHEYFRATLAEAQSALKAIPNDAAPIIVH